MSDPARWSITERELVQLRAALDGVVDHGGLDGTLHALANWAVALIDATTVVVALRDDTAAPLLVRARAGRGTSVPIGATLDALGPTRGGWLRVPIMLGDREVGAVAARAARGHALDDRDPEVLRLIATQAAMAISQDRADLRLAVANAREDAAAAERARLARELHDDTAQQLVAIGRRLDLLRLEARDGSLGQGIDALHDLVDQAVADVRRISRDLRPAILEDLGLKAAIEALIADAGRAGGPLPTLRVDGYARTMHPRVELALFRIVQEALTNALRHAAASRLAIRLAFGARDAMVEIADDGRGFLSPIDYAELVRGGGLGIVGMRERAEEVGGHVEIETSPGNGTVVRARVPAG